MSLEEAGRVTFLTKLPYFQTSSFNIYSCAEIGFHMYQFPAEQRRRAKFCHLSVSLQVSISVSREMTPYQRLVHCGSLLSLRRGVRSDAQLSSTETRFQKCSHSGKNGSKHPMLSTSMADNVISYTKIKRNTKKKQKR